MPGRVFYGGGALAAALLAIAACGRKALVVTDAVMRGLGVTKMLTDALAGAGVDCAVFDGVTGEPTDKMVEAGLAAYQSEGCDFLAAVGGGSPIDTMKAVAAVAAHGGSINDWYGRDVPGPLPPMAAVPTTSGTGSEATRFTIITNTGADIKMLLKGDALMPDIAVVDPAFTMTAPPSVTAATGLDALCHAAESYTSRKAHPVADTFALSAVKRIFQNLPAAFENGGDKAAREQMSLAAFEAGVSFNNSSVTVIHGMSRPIGALFHVPHGVSNAMLLPVCFGFVYDAAVERFADLGRAAGAASAQDADETAAKKFVDACAALCARCGIPTPAQFGIDREAFFAAIPKMAADAVASGSPANTRKPLTAADLEALYKSLFTPCR